MMKHNSIFLHGVLLRTFLLGIFFAAVSEGASVIESRVHTNKVGSTMPYRILMPADCNPAVKYPLVLCLHGAGGRGTDNKSRGTQAFQVLSSPEVQKKNPAFLLTPQCPGGKQWVNTPWGEGSYSISEIPESEEMELVLELLQFVKDEFNIDPDRIYVTGQSMGGFGTWDAVLRYPHEFAAAIPVCGAGDPGQAEDIQHVSIWAFHGGQDPTVPVKGSRDMYEALKKVSGKINYTEYPDVNHNSWVKAWSEEDLIPWLFSQCRQVATAADVRRK